MTLTILYDNEPDDSRLANAWGFACLIEQPETTVLFDTGGDAPRLLANAAVLDKDLSAVDHVVLSHDHGDHTGGLLGLLEAGASPTVMMLTSFRPSLRRSAGAQTAVIEVTGPRQIVPGIWTTGAVSGPVAEQALVVETTGGWVLITGCAHPGVERMAERAIGITGGPIALALGGFHLGSAGPARIEATIVTLKALHVAGVAPTHCTGERARSAFTEAYGDGFHPAGAGTTWVFAQPVPSEKAPQEPQ